MSEDLKVRCVLVSLTGAELGIGEMPSSEADVLVSSWQAARLSLVTPQASSAALSHRLPWGAVVWLPDVAAIRFSVTRARPPQPQAAPAREPAPEHSAEGWPSGLTRWLKR